MPVEGIKISVVICAYTMDRWSELQEAMQSIQKQTVTPDETILVIDHNKELYHRAHDEFTGVKVIENQEPAGLSGARNSGISECNGDVIFFLDEDAVASPDWIENLICEYENPDVAGVGGEVKPKWNVTPPDWFPVEFNWVVGCSYKGLPESLAPIRNPIGCNMSFRREVLNRADGFRNGIGRIGKNPVGCEETELSIRIKQNNPKSILLYQPLAVVYHNVPAWRTNFDYFTNRCYAEGLSKSQVTHYVGSGDGLASERSYVLKTLPMGVLNGIGQSIVEGNLIGLNRSAAIIVGLFFTTLGYLAGIFPLVKSNVQKKLLAMNLTALRQRINIFARNLSFLNSQGNEKGRGIMGNQNNNHQVNLESIMLAKVLDIELSQALPNIDSDGKRGEQDYQRALVLARLHSYPIGMVYLDFIDGQISSGQLASLLWDKFRDAINQHLLADGLEERINLPEEGLTSDKQMNCLAARQESLADAPLISIVIASRDRSQSLSATLNSLLLLDYPNFEIILVDNAPSSDETYELFLQGQAIFARENISLRYVREDTPGLAVAHNRGLELATGVYVAFTDDDVVVDKNWLTEMLRGFKAAESVGCVTGLAVPIELDTPAQVLFEEYGGFIKGFKQNIYDLNKYRPSHPLFPYSPGHFGTGANMGFRTEFLKKSGGFDPALGIGTPTMGADDLSAFFQMIIAGHQLVYQPSALVFHQHRRSYEALRKQMFGYGTGLTVFLMKCAMDHPRLIFDIVPKIPIGLKLAFSTNSAKNQSKSRHYPRELEQLERKGMLYGPLAYLKSRWRYRKIQHNFKPIKISPDSAKVEHYWVRSLAEDYQENKKVKEV